MQAPDSRSFDVHAFPSEGVSVQCLACGRERFRPYYEGAIDLRRQPTIRLLRCTNCGHVQQDVPIVFEYDDVYEADWDGAWERPDRRAALLDIANRIPRKGRLLDVGCGDGMFMDACASVGFECVGVEESGALAKRARSSTGASVEHGRYRAEMFEPGSFDVISFIQVVEHLPDPVATLRTAHDHLKPGGVVCVEVPSQTAPHFLLYRLTRIGWFVAEPRGVIPQHISYFSPRSMRAATSRAGFDQASLTTGRWAAKYRGWKHSVGSVVDPIADRLGVGGILYLGERSSTGSPEPA